jgi:hypothetical protein
MKSCAVPCFSQRAFQIHEAWSDRKWFVSLCQACANDKSTDLHQHQLEP